MSWKRVNRFLPFDKRVDTSELFANIHIVQQEFDIASLYRYGKIRLTYKKDPDRKDVWQPAHITERYMTGDCEDMSIWLCRQGYDKGHNPMLIVGATIIGCWCKKKIPKYPNHVWVEYEGKVYDLAYMNKVYGMSIYGKYLQPMYAYDNEGKYVWDFDK